MLFSRDNIVLGIFGFVKILLVAVFCLVSAFNLIEDQELGENEEAESELTEEFEETKSGKEFHFDDISGTLPQPTTVISRQCLCTKHGLNSTNLARTGSVPFYLLFCSLRIAMT